MDLTVPYMAGTVERAAQLRGRRERGPDPGPDARFTSFRSPARTGRPPSPSARPRATRSSRSSSAPGRRPVDDQGDGRRQEHDRRWLQLTRPGPRASSTRCRSATSTRSSARTATSWPRTPKPCNDRGERRVGSGTSLPLADVPDPDRGDAGESPGQHVLQGSPAAELRPERLVRRLDRRYATSHCPFPSIGRSPCSRGHQRHVESHRARGRPGRRDPVGDGADALGLLGDGCEGRAAAGGGLRCRFGCWRSCSACWRRLRPSVILQEKKKQAASLVFMVDASTSMTISDEVGGKTRWAVGAKDAGAGARGRQGARARTGRQVLPVRRDRSSEPKDGGPPAKAEPKGRETAARLGDARGPEATGGIEQADRPDGDPLGLRLEQRRQSRWWPPAS